MLKCLASRRKPKPKRGDCRRHSPPRFHEMSPWNVGDSRFVALKSADGTAAVIPVRGGSGVDLSAVGRALGFDASTVKLNCHFVSRGSDFVSSLPWDSLLSYFAARGLPAGGSFMDSIIVHGKPVVRTGWPSSSNVENVHHSSFKRKVTGNDEKSPKKNRFLESCSMEHNTGIELETDDDCLCIKRRLKLDDDHPSKKGKIGEGNSGLFNEASKFPMVSSNAGLDCRFLNGLGKRPREDDMVLPVKSHELFHR